MFLILSSRFGFKHDKVHQLNLYKKHQICFLEVSSDQTDGNPAQPKKRWNSMMESETKNSREVPLVAVSQPAMAINESSIDQLVKNIKTTKTRETVCFTQPTNIDTLVLQFTQSPITRDNFHHMVKRMTRFYVACELEKALECLGSVLDSLHYSWNVDAAGTVSFLKSLSQQTLS